MKKITITLIRTKNISALAIHLGMWLYSSFRGLPSIKCYNHAEVRYDNLTSGAISPRVKTRKWDEYVRKYKGKYFKPLFYEIELNEEQWEKGKAYLHKTEGTPYEYSIFIFHPLKIYFNKWFGSKTDKRLACYEHMIRFLNATGKYDLDIFMNPYEFQVWGIDNLK